MYPGAYAADQPGKVAIVHADTGETRTFAELEGNSIRLARYLRELGLSTGANIAFLSDNLPQVFEVYWAGLRSGFYVTGINYHLTAGEAAYILNDCDAQVLLVSSSRLELAREVAGQVPGLKARVVLNAETQDGFTSYSDVLAATSDEPLGDERAA
jgi:fatty-acyl-CoA synthase